VAEPGSREHVLEALKPLGPVMARPELGGTGLLLNGSVFGVLHGGLVYLKVDRKLREEYHEAGMRALEPRPRQKLQAFLEVPRSVVEDSQTLLEHAARAAGRPLPKTPPPAAPAAKPVRKRAPKPSPPAE
jgi:DNA transformation protein